MIVIIIIIIIIIINVKHGCEIDTLFNCTYLEKTHISSSQIMKLYYFYSSYY
jgi:hypothetical protein